MMKPMQNSPKKEAVSLKIKHHFSTVSKEDIKVMTKPIVAKNTQWALKNFSNWFADYDRNKDKPCPDDVLTSMCSAKS